MDGTFTPVEREPVYLKVYQSIEREIAEGRLPAGEQLPTEASLCEQFGVTRSSVREGLRLLEQAGLVARGAGKRLVVSHPQSEDVAVAASRSLQLGGATFRECWESFTLFYPGAARMAAHKLDAGAIDELRSVRLALSQITDQDTGAIVARAVQFFDVFARGLDNRVLAAMLLSLNRLIERSLGEVIDHTPKARARILDAQGEIIGTLSESDADQAEMWMTRHIDDLRRGFAVAGRSEDTRLL